MGEGSSEKNVNAKIDTFIDRLHNLDIILKPEAKETKYSGVRFGDRVEDHISLSDALSLALMSYEVAKEGEKLRDFYAQLCLSWINRAYLLGMIQEGPSLLTKLQNVDREKELLMDELRKCKEHCDTLEQENKLLRAFTPRFTGDVNP